MPLTMVNFVNHHPGMTMTFSLFSHLKCSECGDSFDPHSIQTYCQKCQAPLISIYDLERLKIKPDEFFGRKGHMWRWHELLPVFAQEDIVSLGEGETPILALDRLKALMDIKSVFLKDEGVNPTHCFKARGLSAAISKAKELGIKKIILPSAGNAGVSLATYATQAGISSCIILPEDAPVENVYQIKRTGTQLIKVKGTISDAGKTAREMAQSEGWFDASTFREPYRLEGKKVMGFEIAEWFSFKLPDFILYPTGGGTGLVGIWKAFQELSQLGWIRGKELPRMVAVQSAGCAPVVRSMETNSERCEFWEGAYTIAAGLRVPHSFADRLILRCIRESKGTAVAISDDEIVKAQFQLSSSEGIFACPEGAATLAALRKLRERNVIQSSDQVLLLNTGSGLLNLSATINAQKSTL